MNILKNLDIYNYNINSGDKGKLGGCALSLLACEVINSAALRDLHTYNTKQAGPDLIRPYSVRKLQNVYTNNLSRQNVSFYTHSL